LRSDRGAQIRSFCASANQADASYSGQVMAASSHAAPSSMSPQPTCTMRSPAVEPVEIT
jgi:hypothetical protein